MEIKLLNDNKLKVLMTEKDLSDFSLSCKTIDYDNTETRKAFWSILNDAKYLTGFDAAKEKVYIQVYPKANGGCEMYVTKLGDKGSDKDVSVERGCSEKGNFSVYAFPSEEIMIRACIALSEENIKNISSDAYRLGDTYYLAVDSKNRDCLSDEVLLLCEFGKEIDGDSFSVFSGEYCEKLCCGNAVERFSAKG